MVQGPLDLAKLRHNDPDRGLSSVPGSNVAVLHPCRTVSGTPDAGTGDLTVVLFNPGLTPIEQIRELRRLTGYGLMAARALLEGRLSVVVTGPSAPDAAEVRQSLEAAQAPVELG